VKHGTQCPIACGRCCGDCDRLRSDGCLDPRGARPAYCNTFLCEIAEAVVAGSMSKEDAAAALRAAWEEEK
jgi:hypothetical protein